MKKSIFIFSNGKLLRKGNTIYFESNDGKTKYIPVENTGEILIFGEVDINKKFLDFVSQQEIILHFYNYYGYYSGSFYPREHYNSGFMLLKQVENYLNHNSRINLAKKFVKGAVENISKVLTYYLNRGIKLQEVLSHITNLLSSIDKCNEIPQLMAIEGNVKEQYYNSFDLILNNDDFRFIKRTRQPPENKLNALISFGNSLIYTTILSEIYKTHLDPRIGFLHTPNFRKFTLNLDVAEIFKPIITDRIIFYLVNKNMLTKEHFLKELNGIYLNEKGRRIFVEEFDRRLKTTIKHKKLNREVSYRTLIRMELYKLEKHLLGEQEYQPFVAPW